MNSARSNSVCLKYQSVKQSGYKYEVIRKFEFVGKTQFLYAKSQEYNRNSGKIKCTAVSGGNDNKHFLLCLHFSQKQ